MDFQIFVRQFGRPAPGSGLSLEALQLDGYKDLVRFRDEVGTGTFADGFVSICSVRENISDLGGWQHWLPPKSQMFASSAFGTFYAVADSNVWVVSPQYGEVIESDLTIEQAILELTEPPTRDDVFRHPLFQRWNEANGPLAHKSVLSPAPALALGGTWDLITLSEMPLPICLSLTAQLFEPGSAHPANVIRIAT